MDRAFRVFALAALILIVASPCWADNVVTGDCQALTDHKVSPGVVDADGQEHPGFAGWTLAHFNVEPNFSQPHQSAELGNFCFSAVARPRFTASPAIRTLDWQPKGCNQCACTFDSAAWNDAIRKHEQQHASIDEKVRAKRNRALAKRKFRVRACFHEFDPNDTRGLAVKDFERQLASDLQHDFEQLERDAANQNSAYDATAIESDPICDHCRPCASGEMSQCDSCSVCNASTGTCETTCASGDVCWKGQCGNCCCVLYPKGKQYCQVGLIDTKSCDALNVPNEVTATCVSFCADDRPACGSP